MNNKREYNIAIDYWKFFFVIMVVAYHKALTIGGIVWGGYIAVDFFFVVTGYFMVQSSIEYRGVNHSRGGVVGKQTISFLIKKLERFTHIF